MNTFINSAGGRVFIIGIFALAILILDTLLKIGLDADTKAKIVQVALGTGGAIAARDIVTTIKGNGK